MPESPMIERESTEALRQCSRYWRRRASEYRELARWAGPDASSLRLAARNSAKLAECYERALARRT